MIHRHKHFQVLGGCPPRKNAEERISGALGGSKVPLNSNYFATPLYLKKILLLFAGYIQENWL